MARKALGIDAPNTPCGYANFPCIGDPNYPTCTPMPASCSTTQQQITTEQVSAQNVNNQVTAATSSNTTAIAVSVVFVILFLAALVAGLIVGYRIFKKRRAAKQQITSGFIEIQTIPNSPPMTESSPISPELPRLESITSSDKLLPSPPVHKPVPTKISKPLPNPPSVVPISSPKPPLPAVPLNSPKPPINRNAPKFPIDAQVFAKYSGDGKYYRAVVKQYVQGKYEVAYIDFNNDKEWLTEDCLKN